MTRGSVGESVGTLPPRGRHCSDALTGWPLVAAVVASTARSLLVLILSLVLWAAAPALLGWVPTTVMTGSMMPRVAPGDVVVAAPMATADLLPGRILLVHDPDQPGELRFHRFLRWAEDGRHLITKGDANQTADSTPVSASAVVGVGTLRIPYIGLPLVWYHEHDYRSLAAAAAGIAVLLALVRLDPNRTTAARPRAVAARRPTGAAGTADCDGRHAGRRVGAFVTVIAVSIGGLAYAASAQPAEARFAGVSTKASSSLTTASAYDCYDKYGPAADNPYFLYRFTDNGATATDSGSGARAGTIQGTAVRTTTTCASGTSPALVLAGNSSSYVTGPATTLGYTSSEEIWFKTASSTSSGQLIGFGSSATGSSTTASLDRQLYMTSTGKIAFGGLVGGSAGTMGPQTITSTSSYNNNAWHHAVATVANGNLLGVGLSTAFTLYVDGVQVGYAYGLGINPSLGTGSWRVGGDAPSPYTGAPTTNGYFAGTVDNAAVYTTTLTAAQVTTHYTAANPH